MNKYLCRSTNVVSAALLIFVVLTGVSGCEAQETPDAARSPATIETVIPETTPQEAPLSAEAPDPGESDTKKTVTVVGLKAKIKFKNTDDSTAFSVKPQDDGAKLVDAGEKEIARFNVSGRKLKIKDAEDVVLGYVIFSDGKYKVKNADQSKELWKLQPQGDGDWKFEDADGLLIYKIMKRDYGFEIEDGKENSLSKIKLKDGKTSLRDSSEKTVLSTKDDISTLAFACLGLEVTDSQVIKAALMTMVVFQSR